MKKIMICLLSLIVPFIGLYTYFIRDEFSIYRSDYPEFQISNEANLFQAHVSDDGYLEVNRLVSWRGAVISANKDTDSITIFRGDIIDLESSIIEKDNDDGDESTMTKLNVEEVISFLDEYVPQHNIVAESGEILDEIQSIDGIIDSQIVYKTISINGEYNGKLIMYGWRGEHSIEIPIDMTNIREVVKPDLIQPRPIKHAIGLSIFPFMSVILLMVGKNNQKKVLKSLCYSFAVVSLLFFGIGLYLFL